MACGLCFTIYDIVGIYHDKYNLLVQSRSIQRCNQPRSAHCAIGIEAYAYLCHVITMKEKAKFVVVVSANRVKVNRRRWLRPPTERRSCSIASDCSRRRHGLQAQHRLITDRAARTVRPGPARPGEGACTTGRCASVIASFNSCVTAPRRGKALLPQLEIR